MREIDDYGSNSIMPALIGCLLIFVVLIISNSPESESEFELVKEGKKQLICSLKDGYQIVPKEKIVKRDHEYWIFTNGYARNCYTENKGN